MDKAMIKNFGLTVGAVVVGLAVFNMFVGPMIGRMLAPKIQNAQS